MEQGLLEEHQDAFAVVVLALDLVVTIAEIGYLRLQPGLREHMCSMCVRLYVSFNDVSV